jgi:O-antigen/teichoic acid export membrane protein
MNDKKRIFTNSAAVFISTILDNTVFFAVNIIIARYLSLEHFGEYTTALGYATFFATFTDIGVNGTLQRMASKDPAGERKYFGNTITIKSFFSLCAFAVMAASLPFTNYSRETIYLTLIMGAFRIMNEYHQTFNALLDVKERFFLSTAIRSIFTLSLLCGTACIVLLRGDYFDLAWIRLAVVLVFCAVLAAVSFRVVMPSKGTDTFPAFLRSSIPFGLSAIITMAYQRLNIILLSLIHGSTLAGIFSNGYMFFTTLFFIPANAIRVLLPYLYKIDIKNDPDKFQFAFNFYSKVLLASGFYIMTIIILYARPIIRIIFGAKYDASIIVLQISALGIPFVFTIAPAIITSLDRQAMLARIQIAGLIISIAANILCIRFWSSEGASAASVLTYGFISTSSIFYLASTGTISVRYYWICFAELTAITAGVFYVMHRFITTLPLLPSALIASALFLAPVGLLMIRKNDVRIVKEIIGK